MAILGHKAAQGTLPRNHIAGIRTALVTQNDDTWRLAHQRTYIFLYAQAALMWVTAIFMGISLTAPEPSTPMIWSLLSCGGLLLAVGALQMKIAHAAVQQAIQTGEIPGNNHGEETRKK